VSKRVLVGLECSGKVREALRRRGIKAWSCDTQAAEDGSEFHIHDDIHNHLAQAPDGHPWDGAIFHPVCTYLSLSGVQWLTSLEPSTAKVLKGRDRWFALFDSVDFYKRLRDCGIPRVILENPRMHGYAQRLLGYPKRQEVQPHFFGEPFLKATGFELINVPELIRTHWMDAPVSTKEPERYKQWAACHQARPTKDPADRARERSRTYDGIAEALADAMCRALELDELEKAA
jgi:hypothetical protein